MSRTSRNFVIAYVLLVGLPLLGLAGVLRAGRGVKAPISVEGTWKLETASSGLNPGPCSQALTALSNSPFLISQSGKSLVVSSAGAIKASGSGTLEGQSLQAAIAPSDSSTALCESDQQITLTASVDPKADPKSLTGMLSVNGCSSCAEVKFSAVRLPRTRSGDAR